MKYKANPQHLSAVISNCLREERRIISAASMQEQVRLTQTHSQDYYVSPACDFSILK